MAHPRQFDLNAVDDVARSQGGIVTYRQLRQLGMSNATVSRWTRTGGRWQRLLPGTYLVHGGTPTVDERISAGLQYAGLDARLTGGLALHFHHLRNLPQTTDQLPVHLLVPMRQQLKSANFVIIERTERLPEPLAANGYPLAPLPRAIFDTARRHHDKFAIRAFLLEAVQRKMVHIDDVVYELRTGQRRWTAPLRDVIGDAKAGVRSVQEARLRDIVLRSDLPEPHWNPRLETLSGEFIAEPDGYYEDVGLALEVDSREHHFTDYKKFEKTWSRHSVYNRHGIAAERILPVTMRSDPAEVVEVIRATRAANASRPAPQIRVIPASGARKSAA
ncbi:MAG: type IV toxin-antitoxin system AbiEi family antitoxin domain-containing protein [Actinomycetes bacterium]